uniref:Uncharacterized protein n=1 Tax=mine drainage metagenome TaxID=410659 RepID=E6Q7S0_9ZZZZ
MKSTFSVDRWFALKALCIAAALVPMAVLAAPIFDGWHLPSSPDATLLLVLIFASTIGLSVVRRAEVRAKNITAPGIASRTRATLQVVVQSFVVALGAGSGIYTYSLGLRAPQSYVGALLILSVGLIGLAPAIAALQRERAQR